jgi:acyl carrier protein
MSAIIDTALEDRVVSWCKAYIAKALHLDPQSILDTDDLDRFGLDSSIATSMVFDMEEWLATDIPVSILFEQNNLRSIAAEVARRVNAAALS